MRRSDVPSTGARHTHEGAAISRGGSRRCGGCDQRGAQPACSDLHIPWELSELSWSSPRLLNALRHGWGRPRGCRSAFDTISEAPAAVEEASTRLGTPRRLSIGLRHVFGGPGGCRSVFDTFSEAPAAV